MPVVGRSTFDGVVDLLAASPRLSVDTETTGLRPYHGDRLFSIIIGYGAGERTEGFYFNFQPYEGLAAEWVLGVNHLRRLAKLFSDPSKLWYAHNAKFDLAMLANEGIFVEGTVHCTRALARVEYNEYLTYSLDACAARIGLQKDDTVERYIDENGLLAKVEIPGKRKGRTDKFYHRVPFDIIAPYGQRDAEITYCLGRHQEEAIEKIVAEAPCGTLPPLQNIVRNERRLTATTFRLERVGLLIDRPYCVRAAQYEADRAERAVASFKRATGRDFKASSKLFEEVFSSERERWEYTEKGNPSFEGDILKKFENPAAKLILEYRDAKSKTDFYNGFLYHADANGIVHPNLSPDGAATGRYSSSEPNFQNLTSEEDEETLGQEFVVRRAIIPRPGYVFIMPDFDQMEYRMMLDYAAAMVGGVTPLIQKVLGGHDVHEATRLTVAEYGVNITRGLAKNGNFAVLYGSGLDTLAATIKGTREAARQLKDAIFKGSPEMQMFIREVMKTAEKRRYIINWAGRRSYFPDKNFAYKAPNYLIQGGCADVVKFAMNRVDEYLLEKKSRMILTVHDELPIEVHESELAEVPKRVKEIMESIYPSKYLPLTAGMEWSNKSLADKVKGFPL